MVPSRRKQGIRRKAQDSSSYMLDKYLDSEVITLSPVNAIKGGVHFSGLLSYLIHSWGLTFMWSQNAHYILFLSYTVYLCAIFRPASRTVWTQVATQQMTEMCFMMAHYSGTDICFSNTKLKNLKVNQQTCRVSPQSLVFKKVFKARFKHWTSHVPNLMQVRENNRFFSFALDLAYVKFDAWNGPKLV